jgi:hypothetical protein
MHQRFKPTGISNEGCYANELGDCSTKLSREHYVSNVVLRTLGNSNEGSIRVGGLHWLKTDPNNFPTATLVSKILCKRHNEVLSPLDAVAGRFFRKIITSPSASRVSPGQVIDELFNGHDIERWMLKTLIGICCSGNVSTDKVPIRNWRPSRKWIDVLFRDEPFPDEWGMYCPDRVAQSISFSEAFGFNAISNDQIGLFGSINDIRGTRFILSMAQPYGHAVLNNCVHRPDELVVSTERGTNIIRFAWDHHGEGGSIKLR